MARPSTKDRQRRRRARLRPHPARERIVEVLRVHDEPLSPAKISQVLGTTLGSTAYHIRILAEAGIVRVVGEGRVRGAVEHFYALVTDDLSSISDPITALLTACGALAQPAANGGLPVQTVLDDDARAELQDVLERLGPRVRKIAAASTSRAQSPAPTAPAQRRRRAA